MTTKTVSLSTAMIGPASWRNSTLKNVKLSQNVADRSDRACNVGQGFDPLPNNRDTLAELSNAQAQIHFRSVREVVHTLRSAILAVNDELKLLLISKAALEKLLEHIRKDIKLNEDSRTKRISRPKREMAHDGADDLLQAERMHLLNLKKMLENQLKNVQTQCQALDQARRRLFTVCQERECVLDLVCHSTPGPQSQSASMLTSKKSNNSSGRFTPEPRLIDPLGAYTPEVEKALHEAKGAMNISSIMRKDVADALDRTDKMQKAAHKAVNDGITTKLAETATLKQQLFMAKGENRHSLHRAQRWYDATDRAFEQTRGPLSSYDLEVRERLDRPTIKVFQRHPGNQMPEAQEVFKSADGFLQSLTATSRNIGLLKLARLRITDDMKDKNKALGVDSAILRNRRKKANHRWTLGSAF